MQKTHFLLDQLLETKDIFGQLKWKSLIHFIQWSSQADTYIKMFTIAILSNTVVTANPLSLQTFSWN